MSAKLKKCIEQAEAALTVTDKAFLADAMKYGATAEFVLNKWEKSINEDIENVVDRVEELGGEIKREKVVKTGLDFHDFFEGVTKGATGVAGISSDYKPVVVDVVDQLKDKSSDLYKYNQEYNKHKGNFDQHIALSIPGYRDFQYKIGNSLIKTFNKGVMLDIGASEGTQAKTITSLSGGKIKSISLDPLPAMKETFDSTSQVEGATFSLTALGMDKESEGTLAWEEDDGTPIYNFKAGDKKYDIVQESMVFQFIDNNRDDHIKRAAGLTKDTGIAIFQEKLHNPEWDANEAQKNQFKSLSFRKEDMDAKSAEVLEGMNQNMVSVKKLELELTKNFKHVTQIWDSGNFKGYAASNSFDTVTKFQKNMGDTSSIFDTRSRGVNVEIAPDPNDVEASAEFNELDRNTKAIVTRRVANAVLPDMLNTLGVTDGKIIESTGGFIDDVNPSLTVTSQVSDLETIGRTAGALGSQQSVVVYDETKPADTFSVMVKPEVELTFEEQLTLYNELRSKIPEVEGYSWRDGAMVFSNFSELDHSSFKSKIDSIIGDRYPTMVQWFQSDLIETKDLKVDADLKQKFDNELNRQMTQALRSVRTPESTASTGRNDEGELVSLPIENGMTSVVHFSPKKSLDIIDPGFYGTGAAGVEKERAIDRDWIDRTYFGVEPGTNGGYKREHKVGGHDYKISIPSHLIYDLDNDPNNLKAGLERKTISSYEKAIYDAGYVGYWVNSPSLGMVGVLFEKVKVGQPTVLYQSAVAIRDGRENLKKYGLKPGNKYNTRDIAAAVEARTVEKSGRVARDDRSPESMRKLARFMVQEIKFELEHPGNSGIGWYSEKYQRALDLMAQDFPELATDQNARNTMTALIAITSDGQKVIANMRHAHDVYKSYRETGKFSTDRGTLRQASVDINLATLQKLVDERGVEGTHEYLLQEDTVTNLKKISPEFRTDYAPHIKLPMAAIVFGPKLGAFYGNLRGAHGYLTMDRWWSRTINRYRGTLLTKPTQQSLDRYRKMINEPDYTDDQVLAAVVGPKDDYAARNFKTVLEVQAGKKQPTGKAGEKWLKGKDPELVRQHQIEKTANVIYKKAYDELNDAPFNTSDRTFMLDAVNHAQKSLKKSGIDITVADIQAALWYYEKRLYGELGARQSADISYEDAVLAAMNNKPDTKVKKEIDDYLVLHQAAYHGTPHKVDKFTTEKIGTGEGNQAFGWGLYFAGNKAIAEFYRDALSKEIFASTIDGELIDQDDFELRNAVNKITKGQPGEYKVTPLMADMAANDWAQSVYGRDIDDIHIQEDVFDQSVAFDSLHGKTIVLEQPEGQVYQVELAPGPEEYLLWDRPFKDQPGHIQDKLSSTFGQTAAYFEALGMNGEELYQKLSRELGSDKAASELMHTMGIRGIKYLDAGSRGGAGGSFNFVIFSDDDIAITQQFEQFERGRIYLNDESRTIQLLGASDLSSFLHETGHLFLEMEKVYAKKYGLNENQKSILKWLNLESFDDITVEHHERWAETFEAYLREGKAPSIGLRRAFAAFTRWLKVIYRSLTEGRLERAELSPEITEVFNRLLATQDEIAEAGANPQYDQFFRTKEQAGMSDAQWAEYVIRSARVKEGAEMTLDEKALKQYMKTKTREWMEEKEPLIKTFKESLSREPVYQLLGDLKQYKDDDGVAYEGRFNTNLLKEQLGLDTLSGKLIGKHVKEGGLDPSLVAESYGYTNVKQMYDDLVNSPTLKQAAENLAEQTMVGKYGDILNDGTLEAEAREALVNDDQAAMLLMEIRAMNKQRQKPGINREYLKSQATLMIAGMTYSQIKPDRYYKAMIKAAKDSMVSEDPMASKIQELSNHYLYKESLRVKEQMGKNRRYVKAAQTREYNTKKVDPDYVQQIKMLSNMYDVRQKPEQLIMIGQILDFYHAQRTDSGGELTDLTLLDPNLIRAIEYREEHNGSLHGFELIQFDDMGADDLQGIVDMLRHLRYVGGEVAEMNGDEAIKERMMLIESIRKKGGKDHKIKRGRQRTGEEAKRTWNHIVNTMPSLANMVRKLDGNEGGGRAFDMVYQVLNDASNKKMDLTRQFYDEFEELMGDVSKVGLSRKDAQEFQLESGEVIDFTSEEIYMIALYWGTESSREAIMQGWELSGNDVETIMSTLTDEQLKLVNATWAMNETHWPELSKASVEMVGIAPPKLAPLEFVVNGVHMTGGHMQLFYDSQRIELSNEQESAMSTSSVMPTKAGSLNARVGSGGMPVLLDIGNISRSVDEKIHYIAFAKPGRTLRRLMNHNEVKSVIERKHGPGFYKAMIESIEGVSGGRMAQESHTGFAKVMRWLRTSATMMHLAYSIRNTVQQVGALPITLKEVGPVKFAQASAQLMTQRSKMVGEVNSKSKFMENRAQVVNRESREFMKKMIATSRVGHAWENFKAHGFIFQTMMDSAIAYPTWLASYNNSMEEHGDEKRARTEADTSVAQSVGSGSDLHLGRIMQTNQNEGIKTLTVFGSWFNAYYQRLYKSSKGGESYLNASFAFDALILPFIVANITQALIMDMPDDDEEIHDYLFKNTWMFLAGTVPVMREIGSLMQGFTPSAPINTLPASLVRVPREISSFVEGDQSALKTLSDVGKAITGVTKTPGSGQLWRALDYIDSYIEGGEGRDFNFYQMLTEGADKDGN